MQLLTEFIPIIIFFYVFKTKGLIVATLAAMVISLAQLIIMKIVTNKYNFMQLASFVILLILGGIGVLFKKDIFIKWKPTAIYWILAIILLISQVVNKKPLIEKISNNNFRLPKKVWNMLNIWWVGFFIFMGCLNLYIVYYFDTNTWVNFKLFGTLGLTIIFMLLQAILISKYSKL